MLWQPVGQGGVSGISLAKASAILPQRKATAVGGFVQSLSSLRMLLATAAFWALSSFGAVGDGLVASFAAYFSDAYALEALSIDSNSHAVSCVNVLSDHSPSSCAVSGTSPMPPAIAGPADSRKSANSGQSISGSGRGSFGYFSRRSSARLLPPCTCLSSRGACSQASCWA